MKNVKILYFLLALLSSSAGAGGNIDIRLEWQSGASAIDLDLYVKNPKGDIVDYSNQTSIWGAQHTRDDQGDRNTSSYESFTINLDDMDCYATGTYEFHIYHYDGVSVSSVIKAEINGQAVGASPWTFNTVDGQELLALTYDADQSRCSTNNSSDSSFPTLTRENFKVTYGDFNSDNGVDQGVHSANIDVGLEESQYGSVTLHRKNLSDLKYRYEFTLSAIGSNDIKNIVFIALVEKNAKFHKLPIKVEGRHNNELIGVSGGGIEIREGNGNFYSYTKSGFRDGVSNALHALGGFAVGKVSGGAGDAVAWYGFAKNITEAMFAAVDEGIELLVGHPVGLKAAKNTVLPSGKFSDDVANINNYHAYRLVVPTPSNYTTELNGVRFSIEIENEFTSLSEPRFYLSWVNEKNLDEQVTLELGTKDYGNLRNYDKYIRAASRNINAFE